jgi:hypothetical protein
MVITLENVAQVRALLDHYINQNKTLIRRASAVVLDRDGFLSSGELNDLTVSNSRVAAAQRIQGVLSYFDHLNSDETRNKEEIASAVFDRLEQDLNSREGRNPHIAEVYLDALEYLRN